MKLNSNEVLKLIESFLRGYHFNYILYFLLLNFDIDLNTNSIFPIFNASKFSKIVNQYPIINFKWGKSAPVRGNIKRAELSNHNYSKRLFKEESEKQEQITPVFHTEDKKD